MWVSRIPPHARPWIVAYFDSIFSLTPIVDHFLTFDYECLVTTSIVSTTRSGQIQCWNGHSHLSNICILITSPTQGSFSFNRVRNIGQLLRFTNDLQFDGSMRCLPFSRVQTLDHRFIQTYFSKSAGFDRQKVCPTGQEPPFSDSPTYNLISSWKTWSLKTNMQLKLHARKENQGKKFECSRQPATT